MKSGNLIIKISSVLSALDARDGGKNDSRPWPWRCCAIAAWLMVTTASAQSAPAALSSLPERIDEFVLAEMARQRVPGVAIAIVNKGQVTARGYGYANLEHQVPVTDQTIFQSGSIGKMFTATAVMLLVEEGKLSLSDPMTKFFPDAPETWRKITVRHLLTHTHGLPDYTKISFDYRKDYSEDELTRFAYQLPLDFQPGARFNYSSTGYVLLGIIIHKATGQFYGDFLAEHVFKPVGMPTARIISEADIVPNRAAGYQLVKGELKNQDWVAPVLNTTADGSIYWSLRDGLAWDAAVKQRAILKPESWKQVLTPVRLNSGKTYPYGMGWFLDERDGKPLQHHGGSWQGFKSEFARFAGDDLDIIVFSNLAQADRMRFVDGIAAIMNPSLAVKVPVPIEDREPQVTQQLARLLGTVRDGKLTPADFAYLRPGFFPETANSYRQELKTLGAPTGLQLFERLELGDDRVYLYHITFPTGSRYLNVGLAPDDRLSSFSIKSEL